MHGLSIDNKKKVIRSYLTFVYTGMVALSIGSLMPFLRDDRGFSYAFAGLLVSAHSVGNFIASFFSGILATRIGSKKSILIFEIFSFIAYVLIAFTKNNMLLYVAFLMTGLGRGAVSNFNNKSINDISKGNAWLLNVMHAMFSIGAFLFPLIVFEVTKKQASNYIYIIYLLVLGSILNYLLFFTYPANDTNIVKKIVKKVADDEFGFFRDKNFYLNTFILFFYLCAEQGTIGWLISYFKDTGLLPMEYSQISSSLQWIMILIGRLTVAYLSTKIKVKHIYRFMGIGFFVFCLVLLLAKDPIVILIGIAGFGFSMAGIYPTTVSLAGDIIKKYDMAWSFILTIASLGSIIMPIAIGFIANNFGIYIGMSTIVIVIILDLILICIKSSKIKV